MRVFLTGQPGVGKTTIIKEIAKTFPKKCDGFYTEEIRIGNTRSGFQIITLPDGGTFQLATRLG